MLRRMGLAALAAVSVASATPGVAHAMPSPLDALVSAAAQRLQVADPVAAVKWITHGDIEDPVRVQQVVDAVAPLPVLGAGGIARGRQMAAALALGCEGIWCGSVWLGTTQSDLLPEMKDIRKVSAEVARACSLESEITTPLPAASPSALNTTGVCRWPRASLTSSSVTHTA